MLSAYTITHLHAQGPAAVVNAPSLAKAKAFIYRREREWWPDLRMVEMKGRLHSREPVDSPELQAARAERRRPDLLPGALVTLIDGRTGEVADATAGSCFLLWLDVKRWACIHPSVIVAP